MKCFAFALSLAGVITSSIASPTPSDFDLETRSSQYYWTVTKWNSCKEDYDYSYSFTINGARHVNPSAPGFTATCSGTASGDYADCDVTAVVGRYTPSVSADVTIVKDSSGAKVPELKVHMQWTNIYKITHIWDGQYNATVNCDSYSGKKFEMYPIPSLVG